MTLHTSELAFFRVLYWDSEPRTMPGAFPKVQKRPEALRQGRFELLLSLHVLVLRSPFHLKLRELPMQTDRVDLGRSFSYPLYVSFEVRMAFIIRVVSRTCSAARTSLNHHTVFKKGIVFKILSSPPIIIESIDGFLSTYREDTRVFGKVVGRKSL